jgi:hypothetical protein
METREWPSRARDEHMMSSSVVEEMCPMDLSAPPRLVVVIDTEEEFDWDGEFSRSQTSVSAMRSIGRTQRIFDEFGIVPTYVVDYPVASQPSGYEPLVDILRDKRCLIGAHLHPWVTPPYEEIVSRRLSYPGNLPPALEEEKLRILRDTIEDRFGIRPVVYKAGRYGLGPHTASILESQGFEVDCSVCAYLDSSWDGGPDYSDRPAHPYWFGTGRKLLELPLTAGYTGLARSGGSALHDWATQGAAARLHVPGIFARLGILDKVVLSPEGFTFRELKSLVTQLHADGMRIFSFAFHSPSVEMGHTPYVRTQADLEEFLLRCRRFFDFFVNELGGCPATPLEVRDELLARSAGWAREEA